MAKTKSKSQQPRSANPGPQVSRDQTAAVRPWAVQAGVIFGIALLARLLHFACMRNSLLFDVLVSDSAQYDKWAQTITGGQWLGTEVFYQTPLYPYLLAVIYSVCGHSLWAVRICQALFGALACVALARAGARFFSERVGWVAGVLLALYPPAIFFDGILQKASLDLLLMTSLLWAVGAAQDNQLSASPQRKQPAPRGMVPGSGKSLWQDIRLFAVAGVLVGTMTLNRENAAALFPVLLVWIVWLARQQASGAWLRWGAALTLGAAVILVPVGFRNYLVGGTFALTTSQMGPNLYIGNHPGATGGYETLRPDRGDPRYEAQDARVLAEADLRRPLSAGEVSRYWLGRTLAYIQGDPGGWLRLLGWKWFLTWHAVEMIDAESIQTHAHESPVLRVLGWFLHFGVICPLAAIGIWWTRADWRRLWILYAMLAAFALAVTVFYVFARYRYPLVPVAMLFAGAGVCGAWDALRGLQQRTASEWGVAAALGLGAALFCNWHFAQVYSDDGITYYNAGTSLLDLGRAEDTVRLLKQAEAASPNFSATYNNLGRAALQLGDLAGARSYFEQAVKIDPDHAVYHANLADVAQRQGEPEQAAKHLRQAVQLDPLLVPALQSLARYEVQHGETASGIARFRKILEIEPQSPAAHADLGLALATTGQPAAGIVELRKAIDLNPDIGIGNNLARILATAPDADVRNGAEAVRLAQSICQATNFQAATLLDTLAAAQAAAGNFAEAVKTCDQALELCRQRAAQQQPADPALVEALTTHRQLYVDHKTLDDPKLRAASP